jgi:hypothetical protein
MVGITSLAAFRRFLALPGATVLITRHDWRNKSFFGVSSGLFEPRKVKRLQTNGVCFEVGDLDYWLYWDRKNGQRFRFDGSDTVTFDLNREKGEVMQYRCWIAEKEEAA